MVMLQFIVVSERDVEAEVSEHSPSKNAQWGKLWLNLHFAHNQLLSVVLDCILKQNLHIFFVHLPLTCLISKQKFLEIDHY